MIFDRSFADQYSFAGRPAGAELPARVERAVTLQSLADKLGFCSSNSKVSWVA